jgi:glycosyltransferase involved in cell wall biosynthesis
LIGGGTGWPIGGVETVVLTLARGLAELRAQDGSWQCEVTVVTQTPVGAFDDLELPIPVVRQSGVARLRQLISASNIVHVAGPALAPLLFGLLARKPVVVEHHGFQTICPNGQLLIEPAGAPCPGHFMAERHGECLRCNAGQGWLASAKLWLLTFVRRFLCSRVSVNITPTQWLAGLLQLPRVTIIPHGLEPTNALVCTAASSGQPVIAFQGRLVTTKGVRVLLEAARILREQNHSFELLIIGDGPERTALEQFTREMKLADRVQFTGRLAANQVEAALAQASVVVVPSLGGEVFGLVVAENMQRGLPIVTSDLGAFAEGVGEGGITFRTGDAFDLAAKLIQFFDDSALAARLSIVARQRALDVFCERRMIDDHFRLYDKLVRSLPQ